MLPLPETQLPVRLARALALVGFVLGVLLFLAIRFGLPALAERLTDEQAHRLRILWESRPILFMTLLFAGTALLTSPVFFLTYRILKRAMRGGESGVPGEGESR